MFTATSPTQPWLLIEASKEGVLRYATCLPAERPRIDSVREIAIGGMPTFTDALQQIERESGHSLRGMQCAMAIAGAANGETFSLVRSRWTIARSGLAAIFERPVIVLNDVAARAWAIRSGTAVVHTLRGAGMPSLTRPGRYLMLMVEEGVGASIVDVRRDGEIRILETEAGHMDFAPSIEAEDKLARALRGVWPFVSWERMLMLDRQDGLWSEACPGLPEIERARLSAGLLGRFMVNLMHASGAWQGVMLTGSRANRLLEANYRGSFEAALSARRNFSRLVIGAPVWQVDQREAVLAGAAERLAHGYQGQLSQAAA